MSLNDFAKQMGLFYEKVKAPDDNFKEVFVWAMVVLAENASQNKNRPFAEDITFGTITSTLSYLRRNHPKCSSPTI